MIDKTGASADFVNTIDIGNDGVTPDSVDGESRMTEDFPLEDVNPENYVAAGACLKAGAYLNSIKNSNRYLRIGWNKHRGKKVYRIAIGGKGQPLHKHINIITTKKK